MNPLAIALWCVALIQAVGFVSMIRNKSKQANTTGREAALSMVAAVVSIFILGIVILAALELS